MGLDLALGALVLVWAIRGWFKGFIVQAIGLAGLVGAIYGAAPLRALVRPYVQPYLPSIQPVILDRLLWWTSAVVCLAVIGGLGGWLVKLSKRKTYGPPKPNRTDQGAGFALGALKGLIVAAFVVAGIERFLPAELHKSEVVEEQTKTSRALAWSLEHRPAEQIWRTPPVQSLVAEVRRHGLDGAAPEQKKPDAEAEPVPEPAATVKSPEKPAPSDGAARDPDAPVKTARRTPQLTLPSVPRDVAGKRRSLDELDQELRDLGLSTPASR
jgi:uncharacterized membrane protein required for colicin V production